jgi:hypothetical protein
MARMDDDEKPLPRDAETFLADAIAVIRIQLSHPGRSLRTLKIAASYWPEGRMDASESYPRPRERKTA